MKVRTRALITISLIFFGALVILILVSQTTILAGFEILEKKETQTQTNQAFDALTRELTDLDTLTNNNAAWNETYSFIDNNNTAYITTNWNDQVLSAGNLNLIVFMNVSGQIVYDRAFNTSEVGTQSISDNVSSLFPRERIIWQFSTPQNHTDGLLNIGKTLFLIASRPILKDNFSGPVRGALVLGTQVTSDLKTSLSQQTRMAVNITEIAGMPLPANLSDALTNMPQIGSIYVKPENANSIAGYRLLGDINGNPCAILEINVPRSIYAQGVATVNILILLLVAFFTVFAVTAGLFLELTLLSRVSTLTGKLKEMTFTENVKQRLASEKLRFASEDDELSVLRNSINSLLDKIDEITEKLSKSQRFAIIGELAVMVAHDLRNPLQGITGATEYLERDNLKDPQKKTKAINLVKKDVAYCEKIVNDLLDFSREPKIMPVETDAHSLLQSSLTHVQIPDNVKVIDLTTCNAKIRVDTSMIIRVFDNMIRNAVESMPTGGELTIKAESLSDAFHIAFADTGTGIAQNDLKKLFTPLFTTKAKGMGLGLAICKRMIDAHSGSISVESTPGKGTTFTIRLPSQI